MSDISTPAPPLNASLRQLGGKLIPHPNTATGTIKHVNYVTRRVSVTIRGYGVIKDVLVQEGIQLGTTDRPVVNVSDLADLHIRPRDHRWICTAIHNSKKCATHTLGISPDVEEENSLESANSYMVQQSSSLETPFDLRIPPFELLGQLTPTASRFPDTTTYLCGIPPCTDCGTPEVGKAILIASDDEHPLCYKFSFRRAPCPLSFRWQGAVPTTGGFTDRSSAPAIAVREHFVYVAGPGARVGGGAITDAVLLTYDMSDLDNVILVDTQVLTAPFNTYFADFGMNATLDYLWISGVYTDGSVTDPDPAGTVKYFDISTRNAPSLVAEYAYKFSASWQLHRHYDTGTMTFTGDPMLVGYSSDGEPSAYTSVSPLRIIDGLTGALVGTYTFSEGVGIEIANQQLLNCDNTLLMTVDDPPFMRAVDLTDETTPTLLWNDTIGECPTVYLGANLAYAKTLTSGAPLFSIYTQVNVDATRAAIDINFFNQLTPHGWFLDGVCLYRAGQSSQATSYNVNPPTIPIISTGVVSPIVASNSSANESSADKEDETLYLCQLGVFGGVGGGLYLSVFSNIAP